MNCVIPGQNLKVMGKAIHALAKIGEELYLQATADDMTIRTVNMSKTVFAVYKFPPPFFTHYTVETKILESQDLKCKIPMKAILSVFKSPIQMDKQIELCRIELQPNATKIHFKFRYKHDINRTQSLWLLDGESVQIVYNNPVVPNIITAQASLYTQVLANFQLTDDEVSFEVNPQKIIMRNYIEGEQTKIAHVRSQLSLNSTEFDMYKIGSNTTITFSLKPFRAAINFAEYFNLGITISFQSAGKPAVLIISNVIFEANFVLATVSKATETQSTLVTTVPSVVVSEVKQNLTPQDKTAIESINWDKDFETDKSENLEPLIIPDSPESPRSKKMKFLFKRCFESTYHASQLQVDEVVLAENSDQES